jgi:hypothetical protein
MVAVDFKDDNAAKRKRAPPQGFVVVWVFVADLGSKYMQMAFVRLGNESLSREPACFHNSGKCPFKFSLASERFKLRGWDLDRRTPIASSHDNLRQAHKRFEPGGRVTPPFLGFHAGECFAMMEEPARHKEGIQV